VFEMVSPMNNDAHPISFLSTDHIILLFHYIAQEQNCIAMCMDRYIETMNVVRHTLSERSATR